MLVKLSYFKATGKWYADAEVDALFTEKDLISDIWDWVDRALSARQCPGLTCRAWDGPVLVNVPEHPNNHPRMVNLGPQLKNQRKLNSVTQALDKLITALPTCAGEWLSGSGGHRKHGLCNNPATWVETGAPFAYCDEHIKPHERGTNYGFPAAEYADELRKAIDALKG